MNKQVGFIRIIVAALLSMGLFFSMVEITSAHPFHAKVLKAIPAIGSTITQAPTSVTVFTAENINPDPKNSNLFVYGPSGELISQENAKVSLSNPMEMSITIKPIGNGIYIVRWITASAIDGDPDQGAFFFTVKTGVSATPTTVASQSTPPPTKSGTNGTPLWVSIVVGIIALLIGLGAGLSIRSRQRRRTSSFSAMRKAITAQQQKQTTTKNSP